MAPANSNVSADFLRCDAVTARWEGGYANHPDDPGGATMRGVTQRVYDGWRRRRGLATRPVRQISDDEVKAIYFGDYWLPVHGDDLPDGLDLSVYDYGVNSGPSRAIKDLQRVVGVKADGLFGPITLLAVGKANPAKAVKGHCGRRLGFVQSLRIWSTFGKGWGNRIADIQAKGVAWALAATADPHVVSQQLEDEAAARKKTADRQRNGAGAGGVGGGSAVVVDQSSTQVADWLLTGIGVAVLLVAGYLVIRMVLNRQQQRAYAREAAAVRP